MAPFAEFADGVEINRKTFERILQLAPNGVLSIFVCDEYNTLARLLNSFYESARKANPRLSFPQRVLTSDVIRLSSMLISIFKKYSNVVLLNGTALSDSDIVDVLPRYKTKAIARLESYDFRINTLDNGFLPKLDVEPEEIADRVSGFKVLIRVDPECEDSWGKNRNWLEDICIRCRRLNMPLIVESVYSSPRDMLSEDRIKNLPDVLLLMAQSFGKFGHFYRTELPAIWVNRGKGSSSVRDVTDIAMAIDRWSHRPVILSGSGDFINCLAQYAQALDYLSGFALGTAYFEDAFSANFSEFSLDSLKDEIKKKLGRIHNISELASRVSTKKAPWWSFCKMSDEAKSLISSKEFS